MFRTIKWSGTLRHVQGVGYEKGSIYFLPSGIFHVTTSTSASFVDIGRIYNMWPRAEQSDTREGKIRLTISLRPPSIVTKGNKSNTEITFYKIEKGWEQYISEYWRCVFGKTIMVCQHYGCEVKMERKDKDG